MIFMGYRCPITTKKGTVTYVSVFLLIKKDSILESNGLIELIFHDANPFLNHTKEKTQTNREYQ